MNNLYKLILCILNIFIMFGPVVHSVFDMFDLKSCHVYFVTIQILYN
jgi:hypothetical protein